jgi:hypothetical protein
MKAYVVVLMMMLVPSAALDDGLKAGERVRLQYGDSLTAVGTIVDRNDTALVIRPETGDPVAVDFADIQSAERSLGTTWAAPVGAEIGARAGLAVAIVLVITASQNGWIDKRPESAREAIEAGSTIGGAIGAVAGATSQIERWERVRVEDL